MPGNISNISTGSTCGNYPWRLGYSSEQKASLGSLVPSNNDETLFQHRDIGVEKGVLARFKTFILRPVSTESSEHSVGAWLTLHKEALASKGGARLVQELEQVGSWGRTSVAEAAGSVRDRLDVSLIAERMLASVAQSVQISVLSGVENSGAKAKGVDQSVLESVVGKVAKIVVETGAKIDAKNIAESVAKSIAQNIAERVEKVFKESVGEVLEEDIANNAAKNAAQSVALGVETSVAESVERGIAQIVEIEQLRLADISNQIAKASDVIERRNVEAKSPAPMPTLKELANMKTWLGPENSQERLGRLQEGLLGIKNEQSTPSSTRSAAAQLLEDIRGYGMDFWIGGDRSIEARFGSTSAEGRLEMAMKLNDWADEATELLLKPEAEKLEVKDQGQEALSLGFQYV